MNATRPDDDEVLAERVARGDAAALEELLARHLPGVRAFVRLRFGALLREKESVSDVVQSACREVLEGAGRFRHGGEAGFRAWLYEAAARKIADHVEYWRAAKRDPAREGSAHGSVLPAPIPSPSQEAAGRESLERLERGLAALADDEREIILLARVAGLSHAEIAARLGCSEAAARVRLFRALAALALRLRT